MRYIWTVAPDQERVQFVSDGSEDAELEPTIDFIITYDDPGLPEQDEPLRNGDEPEE